MCMIHRIFWHWEKRKIHTDHQGLLHLKCLPSFIKTQVLSRALINRQGICTSVLSTSPLLLLRSARAYFTIPQDKFTIRQALE